MQQLRQLHQLRRPAVPAHDGRADQAGNELIDAATGEAIAAAAVRLVGAPFQHQGRDPQFGLDCAGVVIAALQAVGLTIKNEEAYRMDPSAFVLMRSLLATCVPVESPRAGDVLALRTNGSEPKHLAVVVDHSSIVHVFGRCSRVRLDSIATWWPNVHSIWRPKWRPSL
jgi:cell wall-associated NlpC family hydrolase